MRILYGTGNAAKLAVMTRRLEGLELEVVGIQDMKEQPPQLEETGETLLENARQKAETYYEAYHMPVFACDTAIYFDKERFPEALQPGIHTRRALGRVMSDEEMIAYYQKLVRKYGEIIAQYRSAVCCYLDKEHIYEEDSTGLWGKPFLLTDRLHPKYQPGFPLDGLSVEKDSGISYYDLPQQMRDEIALGEGIQEFFRMVLGKRRMYQ